MKKKINDQNKNVAIEICAYHLASHMIANKNQINGISCCVFYGRFVQWNEVAEVFTDFVCCGFGLQTVKIKSENDVKRTYYT